MPRGGVVWSRVRGGGGLSPRRKAIRLPRGRPFCGALGPRQRERAIMPNDATLAEPEHYDVLIVGAGISGIGGAYHLRQQCPDKSFIVLDMFESFGGTWWTHRYPGIRSDSDLHTFGYRFKPWRGPPMAAAAEILAYMARVVHIEEL